MSAIRVSELIKRLVGRFIESTERNEQMTCIKFKGAPLPWRYDGTDGSLKDRNGDTICDLGNTSEFSECTDAIHGALMATAPELLTALKYARRFLNKLDHDTDYIDAVITKALDWKAEI